jgi:hypothetical protein
MKFASVDAIELFCGASAKLCTPQKFGEHLGLTIVERIMDIVFEIVANSTQIQKKINNELIERNLIYPRAYRCNESYHFEGIEYGAKCSCKVN